MEKFLEQLQSEHFHHMPQTPPLLIARALVPSYVQITILLGVCIVRQRERLILKQSSLELLHETDAYFLRQREDTRWCGNDRVPVVWSDGVHRRVMKLQKVVQNFGDDGCLERLWFHFLHALLDFLYIYIYLYLMN